MDKRLGVGTAIDDDSFGHLPVMSENRIGMFLGAHGSRHRHRCSHVTSIEFVDAIPNNIAVPH